MKVDFFILNTQSAMKAWHFTCQLIEKEYLAEKSLYVQMCSEDDAARMDSLLWTFKDISFIPHVIYQDSGLSQITAKVAIGFEKVLNKTYDVLINLSKEIPPFYKQFSYIIEIVFAEPEVQQFARERFRYYREQGLTLNTIKT